MFPIAKASRIRRALVFATGQTTQYAGMADDGFYEIGEAHRFTLLTAGQYSGTVNITLNGKTDVKSNACVLDNATGLMWSQTLSKSVGPTSNGLLPWTTNGSGEGMFAYCTAANAAGLAGYSDWKIPNRNQLIGMQKIEAPAANVVDAALFPDWVGVGVFSSTTLPTNTALAISVAFATTGAVGGAAKTVTSLVALVRGPL